MFDSDRPLGFVAGIQSVYGDHLGASPLGAAQQGGQGRSGASRGRLAAGGHAGKLPDTSGIMSLDLNLFYDDGEGYIDLGLDNVFSFDENGGLLGESDGSWLAVNGQPVAYYHTATVDDGTSEIGEAVGGPGGTVQRYVADG